MMGGILIRKSLPPLVFVQYKSLDQYNDPNPDQDDGTNCHP
jgi:hypothetical protein